MTRQWQRLEAGSAERRLCLAMNRWGARHALRRFFGVISRLGDGVFWYALMLVLATCRRHARHASRRCIWR